MGLTFRLTVAALVAQLSLLSPGALARGRVGPDPSSNYAAAPLPLACSSSPAGATCINAGVYYLDRARARLHQGPYKLPADFAHLSPDRQAFILTNLDRVLYQLAPVTGLTAALDRVALGGKPGDPGVIGDGDPLLSGPRLETTSNWAGGFPNIVLAYEAWMYNDGPGSGNLDCTAANHAGCWGHRHDILSRLTYPGPSAMGAAAGHDTRGIRGYAMMLAKGTSSYTSGYSYRWSQAVADGAGTHSYNVSRPDTQTVTFGAISIQGTTLVVHLIAPSGVALKCSLSAQRGGGWAPAAFKGCGSVARFPGIHPGKYRLRVKSVLGVVSTVLTIT